VDGINEYSFGLYPGSSNVIAVTNIWYTKRTKEIVDYDIFFNTFYSWAGCEKTTCTNQMDIQNIATHELGHGLGLSDIYSGACSAVTMYGYSWAGETQKRDLELADIAGIQKIYGE
jgi:hypothetical protein